MAGDGCERRPRPGQSRDRQRGARQRGLGKATQPAGTRRLSRPGRAVATRGAGRRVAARRSARAGRRLGTRVGQARSWRGTGSLGDRPDRGVGAASRGGPARPGRGRPASDRGRSEPGRGRSEPGLSRPEPERGAPARGRRQSRPDLSRPGAGRDRRARSGARYARPVPRRQRKAPVGQPPRSRSCCCSGVSPRRTDGQAGAPPCEPSTPAECHHPVHGAPAFGVCSAPHPAPRVRISQVPRRSQSSAADQHRYSGRSRVGDQRRRDRAGDDRGNRDRIRRSAAHPRVYPAQSGQQVGRPASADCGDHPDRPEPPVVAWLRRAGEERAGDRGYPDRSAAGAGHRHDAELQPRLSVR